MTERNRFLSLLGFALAAITSAGQQVPTVALKMLLNEVQPGTLAAPQYCMLVFDDRHFHFEKADIKHGNSSDRKVFEGQLSEHDWNALLAIIDSDGFRALKVPRTIPPPVMQDTHPYTISVARGNNFQNMEFLDGKSLKPYESQVKPLLQWWKSFRGQHIAESTAPPDSKCALDRSHAIFAQ